MSVSSDRSVRSGGTIDSTSTRKKRTIVVIRRRQSGRDDEPNRNNGGSGASASPGRKKKTIMVSRRPRPSEGKLFDDVCPGGQQGGSGALDGTTGDSSPREKLRWSTDGRVHERSILGTADAFEEMDAALGPAWGRPVAGEDDSPDDGEGSVRPTQTQQSRPSKQSRRSANNEPQSAGDRSEGRQESGESGSRPESSGSKADLQREIRRYMRRMVGADDTRRRNRAENVSKKTKLLERVGLTEKLTMKREGNAMRQWERRQRDWIRVQEDMAVKTGKAPEALVMSTADDFRERSEAYQLIQSAIPPNEKYSSDGYWVMSLRGYGERMCNVGNIFSGLFCTMGDRLPALRTVRKPTGRAADATRKRTWRNSKALALRRRQLAPALKKLAGGELRAEDTAGLLVQGQDLLEWAATSSKEYLELRRMQEMESERAQVQQLDVTHARVGAGVDEGGVDEYQISPLEERSGPAMEVVSPKFLLIECAVGAERLARSTVRIRNIGSTVLFFTWSRVRGGGTIVSLNGETDCAYFARNENDGPSGGGHHACEKENRVVSKEMGRQPTNLSATAAGLTGHASLQSPDSRFFCHQATGTLLPRESTMTLFSFKGADAGVFSDRWRLETVPQASFVLSPPPTTRSASLIDPGRPTLDAPRSCFSTGGERGSPTVPVNDCGHDYTYKMAAHKSNQDGERGVCHDRRQTLVGVEIGLRGVALAPDTREHARKRLLEGVEKGVMAAKVEELVREVVRDVRTPVREEEIRRRQREAFLSANSERGLYFTPRLYDSFVALLQRAKSVALAAEAGEYDNEVMATDTVVETNGGQQDGFPEECKPKDEMQPRPGRDYDQQSTTSSSRTRPISASSSTAAAAANSDDDPERVALTDEIPAAGRTGDDDLFLGLPDEATEARDLTRRISDDDDDAFKHASVTEKEFRQDQTGDIPSTENGSTANAQKDIAAAKMEMLRTMLWSLDCGEWGGEVGAVLDVIEGLSRWIPPPLEQHMVTASGSAETEGASGMREDDSGPAETKKRTSADGGDDAREEGDGGASTGGSDIAQEEEAEDEDEDEDEDEEEEEEEQGEIDESGQDGEDEQTDADNSEADYDGEEDTQGHPLLREQGLLRAQWRSLLLDAELEPETDVSHMMRAEIMVMAETITGAIEEARREASALAGVTTLTPWGGQVVGYGEDAKKSWAAACPVDLSTDVKGGARTRAAAAAKAGNPVAGFLAIAYDAISAEIGAAASRFETNVAIDEAHRRAAATALRRVVVVEGPTGIGTVYDGTSPSSTPPLSRFAVLWRTDIKGKRLLLHADLSQRTEDTPLSLEEGVDVRRILLREQQVVSGRVNSGQDQLFPEVVQLVAEQVRGMLSAQPAAVAIVSEGAPTMPDTPVLAADTALPTATNAGLILPSPVEQPTPAVSPVGSGLSHFFSSSLDVEAAVASSSSSLRVTAAAVSSLLGMNVEFFETVPKMAKALGECNLDGSGSSTFNVRVMMAEGLTCQGVLPEPLAEEPDLSDGEDERLPDFTWGGEAAEVAAALAKAAEVKRSARDGPCEGDLREMLAGAVDVTVLDAPRTLYEPRRKIPWGPAPTTGLTVAGTGLHGDLMAMAYLMEAPDRPLLAVVGGFNLEPRVKLIDGLLDIVDILAIGGGLSTTFLASMRAGAADGLGGDGGQKRLRKWGMGTAGLPRDSRDVLIVARRLLIKARKRGVEVILPSDFVVGNIEVDEFGPIPGQERSADDKEDLDAALIESKDDTSKGEAAGRESATVNSADGDEDGGPAAARGKDDGSAIGTADLKDDPGMGFEYEGETMDISLEDGIPKGFRPMDIGPQTARAFKDAVGRARGILWHGMLGVAECSAFQLGTRDVLDAVTVAHDSDELREVGESPVVVLCGRSLGKWARRLAVMDDDAPTLGTGSGVSHICTDPALCSRILEGRFVPGLSQLSERDPAPADTDLGKVLRRRPVREEEEVGNAEEGSSSDDDSDA